MPLILEDEGKKLNKRQLTIPKKLVNKLKATRNLFDKYSKTKGFKRLNAMIDDEYNKRSNKKDKIHNGDKTISFSDAKKIDFDMRHMAPSPNNLEFTLLGGEDTKNWVHDALRKERTAVKKVDGVKPVPKLEKNPMKTPDAQKDIQMGDVTVRLTESQLLALKEYHTQTSFNFDDEGNGFYGKHNWEHFVDFLESVGHYGTLEPSGYEYGDLNAFVENAKEDALVIKDEESSFGNGEEQSALYDVFMDMLVDAKQNQEIETVFNTVDYPFFTHFYNYDGLVGFFLEEAGFDYNDYDDIDDYSVLFTYNGYEMFKEKLNDIFFENLNIYNFPGSIELDDRGLIYIERAMTIPNFKNPKVRHYGNDGYSNEDFYDYLKRLYQGVGNCWTWAENFSEAYCGSSYGGESSTIIMRGYINPKNVNWPETVYRNCYELNYEKEIYISKGEIEIDRIELVGGQYQGQQAAGKNLLAKPIVVPV